MPGINNGDATPPEIVSLGGVHFRVTDPDAAGLAIEVGALAEGESLICLRVVFTPAEDDGATPLAGDVVALPDDDGLAVLFTVAADAYDLGPDAVGSEALQPGEVLLVQLIDAPEAAATPTHLTES